MIRGDVLMRGKGTIGMSVIMGLGTRKSIRHFWMVRGGCVRYVERFKFNFRVGDQ